MKDKIKEFCKSWVLAQKLLSENSELMPEEIVALDKMESELTELVEGEKEEWIKIEYGYKEVIAAQSQELEALRELLKECRYEVWQLHVGNHDQTELLTRLDAILGFNEKHPIDYNHPNNPQSLKP